MNKINLIEVVVVDKKLNEVVDNAPITQESTNDTNTTKPKQADSTDSWSQYL